MHFWHSFLYFLCLSIVAFILGRLYPRKWLRPYSFPFKSFKFEKNGTIYNKIQIMKWKTKIPDMSMIITKILPRFMSKKRLADENNINVLIGETCVAEATHIIVAILGFGCVFVWNSIGGWILSVLFLLINVPFIIVQRFNRPRLVTADRMLKRRNAFMGEDNKNESLEKEEGEILYSSEVAET